MKNPKVINTNNEDISHKSIDFPKMIKDLIQIEKDNNGDSPNNTITLQYIKYLEEHLKIYQDGYNKALEEVEKMIDKLKESGYEYGLDSQEFIIVQDLKQQLTKLKEKKEK